ncbi:MAG: alpha/beta hydrolase [Isosphaeraceae bacterium]
MNGNPRTGRGVGVHVRTFSRRIGIRERLAMGVVALAPWFATAAAAGPTPSDGIDAPASATIDANESEGEPAYPHQAVRREEYGSGGRSYWLFEPAEPTPRRAPVVVFNHGWLAVNPGAYGAWINHLVRSGNVVIFPRYQRDPITRPARFLPNAVAAVKDALDVLETAPGHVRPNRKKFALIGHSAGGNLAVEMAAVAAESRLPRPRAVITLMPGEVIASAAIDLARVPAETLLVVAVAENDVVVGDARAREIFEKTTSVPRSRKRFLFYRSDLHGIPVLLADHFLSTGFHHPFDTGEGLLPNVQKQRAEINAFDRAGLWPMADLTLRAAFDGQTLDDLGDQTALVQRLGFWSDGRPVTSPIVTSDLVDVPRVFPAHGIRMIRGVVSPAIPSSEDPKVRQVAGP